MAKKKSKKKMGERVTEYFKVGKNGKVVKAKGEIKSEKGTKKEIQEYNKVLIGFLSIIGIFILLGLIYWGYSYHQTNFEYRGVKFKYVKEGNLYFYRSQIPLQIAPGKIRTYNIYTRKDPREIDKEIPFYGNIELKKLLVLNSTDDFICDGDGTIGVANIVNLHGIIGGKAVVNSTISCSEEGDYMYLLLDKGEENKIEQIGEACYKATISNCDILKVTERFLYESLVEIKKKAG